jgi:hypothetical protein
MLRLRGGEAAVEFAQGPVLRLGRLHCELARPFGLVEFLPRGS